MATVAGIDGCRGGWLYLSKDLQSSVVSAKVLPDIGALATLEVSPDLVMIDVPIGLTGAGARECDMHARRVLKGAAGK